MDFTLSKEHEMARALFKEFAEKEGITKNKQNRKNYKVITKTLNNLVSKTV